MGARSPKPLHGVLQDPLLRPRWLTQAGWPRSAGLFVVQAEELQLGGEVPPELRCVLQLVPLSRPWPSSKWCVNVARAAAI